MSKVLWGSGLSVDDPRLGSGGERFSFYLPVPPCLVSPGQVLQFSGFTGNLNSWPVWLIPSVCHNGVTGEWPGRGRCRGVTYVEVVDCEYTEMWLF